MDKLRVIFLGGRQAGAIGLLATIAAGCDVKAVVPAQQVVEEIANRFMLPTYLSVKQDGIYNLLSETDLIISVHSREIVPVDILGIPKFGGINVHPCLAQYKGRNPIQRFLANGTTRASVGVHRMTEEVDMGKTLAEIFVDIDRSQINSVFEVYNILYPIYAMVLLDVLRRFQNE